MVMVVFLSVASIVIALVTDIPPSEAAFCGAKTKLGGAFYARKFQQSQHGDNNWAMRGSSLLHLDNPDHPTAGNESAIISRRGLLIRSSAIAAAYSAVGPHAACANDDVEAKSAIIAAANTFVRDDVSSPLDGIDWNKPKNRSLNMERMADAVNDGLIEREWFVTGNGLPEYFSDNFVFADPQVSLVGFQEYCRGVRRLFDQDTARCEVVCCSVTSFDTITVLWRNSGRVTIGALSVDLKPYLVRTILTTDPNDGNLIVSQVDEFDSDPLGLALYQVPALRSLAGRPTPSVEELKRQCDFSTCKIKV